MFTRARKLKQSLALLLCALASLAGPAAAYDWLQFGGNPQHNGLNTSETILTPANIGTLTLKYQVTLAGNADGAPIFLQGVTTASGVKDLLFVTTRDGRIIALDAQTGAVIWNHVNGPGTCTINNGATACYTTSSAAIDPNRLYVYSYGLDGKVHKYQVGDGTEIATGGWPQTATLKGYDEKGSSALGIATSGGVTRLYVTHGGYPGDNGDYQGHVTAINLSNGTQKVFNTACSDKTVHLDHFSGTLTSTTCATVQKAIWSRPGVVYDPGTDLIFMATGNTFTNANPLLQFDGLHNWSESVLALHPDASGGSGADLGKPFDSYTPSNWGSLDGTDADVGSTAPTILPVPAASAIQHLAVQSGKDGMVRLLNLDDLSGMGGPGHLDGSVGPPIAIPQGGNLFSQPAVWVNPADSSTWIFIVNSSGASALRLNIDGVGNPSLSSPWKSFVNGTSPVVANNMLFYMGSGNINVLNPATGSVLRTVAGAGSAHWHSLIVANGVVYATDSASHLTAFSSTTPPATTTALSSSANPANAGTTIVLTAKVTGATPTGTVAFNEGAVALAGCSSVALNAATPPAATCSVSNLSIGTHSFVATYAGDANNAGSSSSALSQLIQTAAGGTNVALASAGAVASASSSYSVQYPIASINDNDRMGANWGNGGGWADSTANVFPDWAQINFSGNKTIDRIVVYTLQDNYANPIEPTDALTFTQYGITAFRVQTWNGSSWITQAAISNNNLVKRTVTFAPVTTNRIRISVTNAPAQYSRIVEVEAWGTSAAGPPPAIVTLNSSVNPSSLGMPVAFTATVAGTAPTGSVNFIDGTSSIAGCSAVALAGSGNSRTAQCTSSSLTAGAHSIVAAYGGDSGNGGSNSATLSQGVNTGGSINIALASNGGTASASSTYNSHYPVRAINNNERAGTQWGNGGGWADGTTDSFPDWVQIRFGTVRTVNRVTLYTVQDNYSNPIEPTDASTFTLYGVTAFNVQGKQGKNWVTLATVTGNNLVKRTVDFAPFATDRIRVNVNSALGSYSRITELEVWGN